VRHWRVWYCDSTAALLQRPSGDIPDGDSVNAGEASLGRCGTATGAGAPLSRQREERHE
jgi:hypothetical protein